MSFRIHNPGVVEGTKLSKGAADWLASLESRLDTTDVAVAATSTTVTEVQQQITEVTNNVTNITNAVNNITNTTTSGLSPFLMMGA